MCFKSQSPEPFGPGAGRYSLRSEAVGLCRYMPPKNTINGNIAEANIVTRLIEEEYVVSQPFNEGCRYDFILDDGDELQKVQCKLAHEINDGKSIRCDIRSTSFGPNKTYRNTYSEGEIDIFAVYWSEGDEVFLIPFEETGDRSISIYVGDTSQLNDYNQSRVRNSEEYRIGA